MGRLPAILIAGSLSFSGQAAAPVAETRFEVRVDLRADRGFRYPLVEARSDGDAVVADLACLDDGANGDSKAGDRLFLCRGSASKEGAGQLVVLGSSGSGAAEELERTAFTFGPGKTVRWSWKPTSRAGNISAAGRLVADSVEKELQAEATDARRPKEREESWFGGPVVRATPQEPVLIPSSVGLPPWYVWAAPFALGLGIAALRAVYGRLLGYVLAR